MIGITSDHSNPIEVRTPAYELCSQWNSVDNPKFTAPLTTASKH